MALIPISHPTKLRSAAGAAALFRALGAKRISVRGLRTTEPARFVEVIDAYDPGREGTISFEAGTLTADARTALDKLAIAASYGYLDLRSTTASLRIWPALHSWVHATLPPEGVAALSALAKSPVAIGTTQVGDTRYLVDPARSEPSRGFPIDIETHTIATALRLFHGLTDEHVVRGHLTGLRDTAKPLVARFLTAIGATVHAMLELEPPAARELTELFAGEPVEWQANGIIVEFPAGAISGFLTTPNDGERDRAIWQQRVSDAVQKAKL